MCKYEENLFEMDEFESLIADICDGEAPAVTAHHQMSLAEKEFAEWCRRQRTNRMISSNAAENILRDEDMEDSMELIRGVFEDMELQYREYEQQRGVYAFELGVSEDDKRLCMKVYLESDPRACRIDAVYPFRAEPEFIYPLCAQLAKENYPRRYGALKYDESDGELSYQYSFPMTHGLHEDDFHDVFVSVLLSANSSYDVVKRCAIGRFQRAGQEEIIHKAQKLIAELDG